MKTEPFSLEAAKAGRQVVTRDGKHVEIVTLTGRGEWPIIGYVGESNIAEKWHDDGTWTVARSDFNMNLRCLFLWTLPPCPVEGRNWHREDGWTAEMLPDGYRPLMDGEIIQKGDYFILGNEQDWDLVTKVSVGGTTASWSNLRFRTRRPALPVQPVVVPYTRDTLPELPFEVRHTTTGDRHSVRDAYQDFLAVGDMRIGYDSLRLNFTRRDGSPCGTEASK